MESSKDGNSIFIINQDEIQKTHTPDGKKVDIRLLHNLINKTLMPSATRIVERDHRVVDANPFIKIYMELKDFMGDLVNPLFHSLHLNRFKGSTDQELAKTVHKIYRELSCKCSKGGDVNSATVALFQTLSNYSWEVKMVLAFAAFAVVYGESSLMVDQTEPLAESVKLLKQSPNKSKLWKIQNLIHALVKVTNTIVEIGDSQSAGNIETVVSWTVGTIVVCMSHITASVGLDDGDTKDVDLFELTKKVDEMNMQLARGDGMKPTRDFIFDVNAIRSTHVYDGKIEIVELNILHKFINEILVYSTSSTSSTVQEDPRYRLADILLVITYLVIGFYALYHWNWIFTCCLCFWVLISVYTHQVVGANPLIKLYEGLFIKGSTGNQHQNDGLVDQLKSFRSSSEDCLKKLTETVKKICEELLCKCSRGGDENSKTVALFKMLSHYSWEAKMVLTLASFAVIYGESSLMAKKTNSLADSIKLLKQSPGKSQLFKIQSLINVIVKVTERITQVEVEVKDWRNENISTHIETTISWIVGSVIVCTSHVIGLDDEYTDDELLKLRNKIDGLNTQLGQELDTWHQSFEAEAKRKADEAAEAKRITDEAVEAKRIADEAEAKRIADEAEAKRITDEAAEAKRIANEAAEAKRKADEAAEAKRVADEAEAKRIADEAAAAEHMEEVAEKLRGEGLKSSNLIIGIDFSGSNEDNGQQTFEGRSLHDISGSPNPYQQAIKIIGETLSSFAKDNKIYCYGFGDITTHDKYVFSFHNDLTPCQGFEEVLTCYKEIVQKVTLYGPTCYAPIIEAAIDIVEKSGGQHHVLVIIADDWIKNDMEKDSIVTASGYPLSIVYVGVGDAPWDKMDGFGAEIDGRRKFDNFQFVPFYDIMKRNKNLPEKVKEFSRVSTEKIAMQYKASEKQGFLGNTTGRPPKVVPMSPSFML